MRSSPVVVTCVLSHHHAQVPFAEDQHPVGDLRPGGEHKPFGISVCLGTSGRDLDLWVPKTCVTWEGSQRSAVSLVQRSTSAEPVLACQAWDDFGLVGLKLIFLVVFRAVSVLDLSRRES